MSTGKKKTSPVTKKKDAKRAKVFEERIKKGRDQMAAMRTTYLVPCPAKKKMESKKEIAIREQMEKLREKFFKDWNLIEDETQYKKNEFDDLWNLSHYNQTKTFTLRIGHIGRAFGSLQIAVLYVFLLDKMRFAHGNNKLCNKESLFFEGRQWCYASVKTLLRTGLFSGRGDVQRALTWLIDRHLIYKREQRNNKGKKGNPASWYAAEMFHPALLFTWRQLREKPEKELRDTVINLQKFPETREARIKEILERLITGEEKEADELDEL